MRDQKRIQEENRYVRELCWWMKHATGPRRDTFEAEARRECERPSLLTRIEPVLDLLEGSNYELPVDIARRLYQESVDKIMDTGERPSECSFLDCSEMPVIFDAQSKMFRYYGDAIYSELKNGTAAEGVWLCQEHAASRLFPVIELLVGYTEGGVLDDFESDGMFPGGRPRQKSALTKVAEHDTV